MEKKEIFEIIFIVILVLMIIGILFLIVINETNSQLSDYYYNQSKLMCLMANEYRNIAISSNPELKFKLPDEINCTKILELDFI